MRFRDPLGLFEIELPLGWAYDLWRSAIYEVEFRWWSDASRAVGIQVFPALVDPVADDEAWFRKLASSIPAPEFRPHTYLRFAGRAIALNQGRDPGDQVYHRRVYVRGRRLSLALHHAERRAAAKQQWREFVVLTPVLERVVRTLRLAADESDPAPLGFDEVLRRREQALAAAAGSDPAAAIPFATEVMRSARDALLIDAINGKPMPLTPLQLLAESILILGAVGDGDTELAKAAERVALRGQQAITLAAAAPPDVVSFLREITQAAAEQEARMVSPDCWEALARSDDFYRRRARAEWARRTASEHAARGDSGGEDRYRREAVDELLIGLGAPSFSATVPGDLIEALRREGVTAEADVAAIAWKIQRTLALGELRAALADLEQLSVRGGDAALESEITRLLVAVAEERLDLYGHQSAAGITLGVTSTSTLVSVVEDNIHHAYALFSLGDEPSLADARAALQRAATLLDQMEQPAEAGSILGLVEEREKIGLRAHWCLACAKVEWRLGNTARVLECVERGMRAAPGIVDDGDRKRTLRELEEIRALARGDLPPELPYDFAVQEAGAEAHSPYERLYRALYACNEASRRLAAGDHNTALRSIRAGLAEALSVSPNNEYVPRLLLGAAQCYWARIPVGQPMPPLELAGWYVSIHAAADALDARRALTRTNEARISAGESVLARAVAEEMIGRLTALNNPDQAVEAADRSCGRTLEEELHERERAEPAGEDVAPPLPPELETDEDLDTAILSAAQFVSEQARAVLAVRRSPEAMSADEITELARELGAAALFVQPAGGRVALLAVLPDGRTMCEWSAYPRAHLERAAQALLAKHNPVLAARYESKPNVDAGVSDAGEPERALWDAIVEPIAGHLEEGSHLVIVPSREFSLVPFMLLRDREGRTVQDRFVMSLVPSLATLRRLRRRGSWSRPLPRKAYLLGDPRLEGRQARMFAQLDDARREVPDIAMRLSAAGMPEGAAIVRVFEQATETSYRAEAAHSDLVHLACHAYLPVEKPELTSYLVLAREEPHDGLLMVSEVPDVPLADALVFLGACESGQGRPTADGVIGLGRAFIEAGARAVVLSLWFADDRASARLSKHFYDALLDSTAGRNAAEALREAAQRTRHELEQGLLINEAGVPLRPKPELWAPFVIVGDAQAVRFSTGRDSIPRPEMDPLNARAVTP